MCPLESNDAKSSIATQSTNISSLTSITMTTLRVQKLIDKVVESRKSWTPQLEMETSVIANVLNSTDVISLLKAGRGSNEIVRFSSADYPVEGKFKGSGWKKVKGEDFPECHCWRVYSVLKRQYFYKRL